MKRLTKALVVVICLSVCAAGAVLSLNDRLKQTPAKTKVVPVNNHARQRAAWIWA